MTQSADLDAAEPCETTNAPWGPACCLPRGHAGEHGYRFDEAPEMAVWQHDEADIGRPT